MNVQLYTEIMAVVISTVTTLLGRITVPVTVAGDWVPAGSCLHEHSIVLTCNGNSTRTEILQC